MKDRGLVMIPGPIEFCPKVLRARGKSAASHEAPNLTAPYYPKRVDRSVLGHINKAGIILAGGLHLSIKAEYFRIGDMDAVNESDILATVGAMEQGFAQVGSQFETGIGLAAAPMALSRL